MPGGLFGKSSLFEQLGSAACWFRCTFPACRERRYPSFFEQLPRMGTARRPFGCLLALHGVTAVACVPARRKKPASAMGEALAGYGLIRTSGNS
jgi:hypothetical protein